MPGCVTDRQVLHRTCALMEWFRATDYEPLDLSYGAARTKAMVRCLFQGRLKNFNLLPVLGLHGAGPAT